MPQTPRRTSLDPSHPEVLRRTDWLSGPDAVVLERLAPLRWDLGRDVRAMRDALRSAIDAHRPRVVAALLDAGIPVNGALIEAHREVSPLRVALTNRNPEVLAVLLERGARLFDKELDAKPIALWLLAAKPARGRSGHGDPSRKRARDTQILDLLAAHGLVQRPDPDVMNRLARLHNGNTVVDEALAHGLLVLDPVGDQPDLLALAAAQGQEALLRRLIASGMRPRTDRPHALDDLVLAAVHHAPRTRDVPGRWQHRALGLIEQLVGLSGPGAVQASLIRLLAQPVTSTVHDENGAQDAPRPGPGTPMDPRPVLRLAADGVWPQAWWAAVRAVDAPAIERWLDRSQGACAHWVDEHNHTALHVLMKDLLPVGPLEGFVLDRGEDQEAFVAHHGSSLTDEQKAALPVVVRRLLRDGASPLWGTGGMSAPGPDQPHGALWFALDTPGALGEDLATMMLDALNENDRAPLLARAVADRRSRRTLDRLVTYGVPLDGRWQGQGALHQAVRHSDNHARLAVLLAHGVPVGTRNEQGQTPRDLAQDLCDRYQGSTREAGFFDQARQLDVATLEQAVQESLPDGPGPIPRARARL